MNPRLVAGLRVALLLALAVLIQSAFGDDLRAGRVAPDLMVLLVICAGLTGGTESGAWVGFWTGLLYDMFLTGTPVGLSALTYCMVGSAIGALRTTFLQERRALLPIAAFVGTLAAVLLFVAAG